MTQATISMEASELDSNTEAILISQITPSNFLSFGPDTEPIELRALNVLIGANGSGKSNLIEAIAFLRAAPTGFQKVTGQGGGVSKWIWKGNLDNDASVSAVINDADGQPFLEHKISFRPNEYAFQLTNESLETIASLDAESTNYFFASNDDGRIEITVNGDTENVDSANFAPNASIVALFRDPERYNQLTYLAEQYSKISIYRDWRFGRDSILRTSQRADTSDDRLEEDFSNLGQFLNRIRNHLEAGEKFLEYLREIYGGLDDLQVSITEEGTLVSLNEGEYSISATRLSDGTLRYLALAAILCDPNPPPLICIEEPEMGLHTDLMLTLARLLLDASQRTQLIVTTHSDILVDALTEYPETVVVCEKRNGQTQMKRLKKVDLQIWLEKYSLGSLWIDGEIGGKRQ